MYGNPSKTYTKEFASISNDDYYSQAISADYRYHDIYIEFYSSSTFSPASLITKDNLTGPVTFSGTPVSAPNAGIGEEYLSVSDGTLTLGTADYTPATATGLVNRVRVNLNTIAGGSVAAFRLVIKSSVA